MIELVCGKEKWRVTIEKAQSILHIQKAMGGGWRLPDNYQLNSDGTISRTSKVTRKGKAEAEGTIESGLASEQAEVSHGDGSSEG